MIKLSYLSELLILCLNIFIVNGICAQSVDTLAVELVCNNLDIKVVPSDSSKSLRLSSMRGGKIKQEVSSEIPDSLQTAVRIAKEVWEAYISDSLNVKIEYVSLSDIDTKVEVKYQLNIDDNIYYPLCLFRKLNPDDSSEKIDATIKINKNTNWRVGLGDYYVPNTKNLSYAMLQSFATVLGFTSSVKKDKRGNFKFNFINKISVFDKLIFSNSGERLENISSTSSTAISDFVQQDSGYLYVLKANEKYKLYAPEVYDEYKSLMYMLDTESLMYYNETDDSTNKDLIVDDVTIDILNAMGWNIPNKDFRIVGRDIDETGIASAYTNHTFYIQSTGMNITNHSWEYRLPLKSGGYVTIATATSQEFTIPAIINADIYEQTLEGDIRGVITFTGLYDNEEIKDTYNITLELEPCILSAEVVDISQSDNYDDFYNAIVDVYYTGCHYLYAYVEEEYSSYMNTYYSDRPYYTQLRLNDIDGYGYAWINIVVRNNYGSDNVILEIPYQTFATRSIKEINMINNNDYAKIEVWDIDGKYYGSITTIKDLQKFDNDMLILKLYNDSGLLRTVKYIRK